MLEKKIDTAKNFLEKNIDFLQCPICGSPFTLNDYHVSCETNHTYDISKKGYINLFNGQTKIVETYDKRLFAARKIVSDCGLYNILCENIAQLINNIDNSGTILDAGCGGGNVTFDIFDKILNSASGCDSFFALDLSKDGIDFAASNFFGKNLLWLVGNLNNMPFKAEKIDVILNILSPANHTEFRRILRSGGTVIKILHEADYLKELRRFIYRENDHNEYSNRDVQATFAQNIDVTHIADVNYTHTVSGAAIPALFDMTPLTSKIHDLDNIRSEFIEQHKNFEVTLAFKIIAGKYAEV